MKSSLLLAFVTILTMVSASGCKDHGLSSQVQFDQNGETEADRVKAQRERFMQELVELGKFKTEFNEDQIQSTCGIAVGRSFNCFAGRAQTFLSRTGNDILSSHGLTLLVAIGDMAAEYERRGKPTESRLTALAVDYMEFMVAVAEIANAKRSTFQKAVTAKTPSFTLSNEENQLWKLSMRALDRADRVMRTDENSRLSQLKHGDRAPASFGVNTPDALRSRLYQVQRQIIKARAQWRPSNTGFAINMR